MTEFLEQLVKERIDARTHHHHTVVAPLSNDLDAAEGEPLLLRAATLRGRESGSSYVYAESIIVTNRLPVKFCLRLESSLDPIGRILEEMGIAVTRKTIGKPDVLFATALDTESEPVRDYLLTRTYRLESERIPLMIITEWFLKTLSPFLLSQYESP